MGYVSDINKLDPDKVYSYADYLLWQFRERVELIKGKIFKMSPAPTSEHQYIVSTLNFYFFQFLKGKQCKVFPAPFDVRLFASLADSDENIVDVVQPDLTVICDLSKIDEKGCKGAPDLIVEVISKGSVTKDLHEKFDLYEANGVKEYWVVQPNDKTLSIFELDDQGKYKTSRLLTKEDFAVSSVLPGFAVNLSELFEDLLQEPTEPYGPNVRRI